MAMVTLARQLHVIENTYSKGTCLFAATVFIAADEERDTRGARETGRVKAHIFPILNAQ